MKEVSDTPIFILVGGLGTRLRSVVKDLPKPMADVNGKPFLEYLIKFHSSKGFKNFVLLTGYLSETIEDYFGDGSSLNVSIKYSVEKERLGTGGAAKLAVKNYSCDSFFLINGDTFSDFSLSELLTLQKNCIGATYLNDVSRYGSIETDDINRVVDFNEKKENAGAGYINSGSYYLHSNCVRNMDEEIFSLEEKVFPRLVSEKSLFAFKTKGEFLDIGIPEDYAKCEEMFRRLNLFDSE